MSTSIAAPIETEHVRFMEGRVSISLGACDAGRLPSVCRALGCRVSPDRMRITLFLSASQGRLLLADVRASGAIAVAFSLPSTHRTLQMKGCDARVLPLVAGDAALVDGYRDGFVRELEPLGYDPLLVRTFLACADDDLVAIEFTPAEAYDQTPGPRAGEPLAAGA